MIGPSVDLKPTTVTTAGYAESAENHFRCFLCALGDLCGEMVCTRSSDRPITRFLRSGGHLHDLLLNGVGDQLRFVVDVELAHQVELVGLDRLDT